MDIFDYSNWLVVQINGRNESLVEKYIRKLSLNSFITFLPKKRIKIRKNKKLIDVVTPLYPGYLFLLCEKYDAKEACNILKVPNVIKIIGGIRKPSMLTKTEIHIVKQIQEYGLYEYSKVVNDSNKIRIISGPLKDLEGFIINVDRRKQRAILRVPLFNSQILLSMSFEYLLEKESNMEKQNDLFSNQV